MERLFAGVFIGWETSIGEDFDSGKLGAYCALSNLGFSATTPPTDPAAELESVINDHLARWATAISGAAGISADQVFSHLAVPPEILYEELKKREPQTVAPTYSEHAHYAPPRVAISEHFRPGYSTYLLPGVIDQIAEVVELTGKRWVSSEGSPILPDPTQTVAPYLDALFGNGAAIVNLWGFSQPEISPFRKVLISAGATQAYQAFLRGQ